MANLPESNVWEPVYQLEETDPVQGGPNGIDNLQGKQLANRTFYLKALVEALGTGKVDQSALASQAEAQAGVDNTKWMSPLRVAQAIVALATIAAASDTVAGKVELATIAETITGTDTQRATHPAGVKAAINAAINALVGASPTTLDTLTELAAALGNDPNFATTITAMIGNRQPLDGTLTALSGIVSAANKLIYATGADAFDTCDLSPFARTLIDDINAGAMRDTLGLGDVSQLSIATAFAALLSVNGYQKLPGGLIIQWGVVSTSAVGSTPFSFPIAFTASCFAIVSGNSQGTPVISTFTGLTKTGATVDGWNLSGARAAFSGVFWIAIGY